MELEPNIWFHIIIILFLCVTILPISRSQQADGFSDCYYPFQCGNWSDLRYPFWSQKIRPPYCGGEGFELHCPEDEAEYPSITFDSQTFNITSIHYDSRLSLYNMKLVRADVAYDNCFSHLTNTSLSTSKSSEINLSYGFDVKIVTLFYDCPANISGEEGLYNFTCQPQYQNPYLSNNRVYYYHVNQSPDEVSPQLQLCEDRIQVPISGGVSLPVEGDIAALNNYLNQEFDVAVYDSRCTHCWFSKGICGSNSINTSQFICYYRHPKKISLTNKAIVASVACLLTAIVILGGCYIYRRRKRSSYAKSIIQSSQATSSDFSSKMQDSELGSKSYVVGVHVFTYTELEEATDHFNAAKELGDGGFGTVYFGKLQDGRCVAVKRLYENNYKRVEQFMNEVEILSTLRHQNLVSLYGCTSRHSRELLLVYEYIPNGTVADHLHGERAKPGSLPWSTRMNIAIETASALVYLHAKDIIHRDVKTNNILLDNHFCVKVADFGLSRLFPEHVTHISTAPQGTPGYVDPEYHECYQLTHKSDVYSFGVVLIELISSMPAVDITRHRHEINLSTMAINKIQNRALHELVDPTLGFERDYKVRKMINGVAELAFQCLQSMKDLRPSMEEVLDVLRDLESDGKLKEGKAEVMDISADDVGLLKNDMAPPLPSPDSKMGSKSTTPNTSN